MALAHPERVESLIVQDAVAHNEGLGANWKTRRDFWKDRAANETALRTNLLSLQTTRTRHVGNDPNVDRYDPDLWVDEFAFLNQPEQAQIQSDLFYDYRTNVEAYRKWQEWIREKQPRVLVIWGKYDLSFDPGEPERCRKDVPNAEVHVLEAGSLCIGHSGRRDRDIGPKLSRAPLKERARAWSDRVIGFGASIHQPSAIISSASAILARLQHRTALVRDQLGNGAA